MKELIIYKLVRPIIVGEELLGVEVTFIPIIAVRNKHFKLAIIIPQIVKSLFIPTFMLHLLGEKL